jgi:acetolactate synthase-1/3 small subunit
MVKKKNSVSQSVYGTGPADANIESHTLSILVDNEPGVLARVIGLYSGRGYNIESLTVAETDHANNLSRITIICTGTPLVIEQIKNQLDRLVPVHRVTDLTLEGEHVERELALIKVASSGAKRVEALQTADIFRARVVDSTSESYVFEVTGSSAKVNAFIDLMRGLGMIDVSRTGVAAMSRGAKAI